jgi:hypothetical protein
VHENGFKDSALGGGDDTNPVDKLLSKLVLEPEAREGILTEVHYTDDDRELAPAEITEVRRGDEQGTYQSLISC